MYICIQWHILHMNNVYVIIIDQRFLVKPLLAIDPWWLASKALQPRRMLGPSCSFTRENPAGFTWKKYEFHIVSLMESRKPSTVDSPYQCEFMRMVLRMVGDGGHQPMSKIDQSPSDLRLTQWQRWLATIQCLVNGVGHWLHWMEHIYNIYITCLHCIGFGVNKLYTLM